jgi:hypothetical protein
MITQNEEELSPAASFTARIRAKALAGTAERPRLNVYRSVNHIYAQVIDDQKGETLISASSIAIKLKHRRQRGGGETDWQGGGGESRRQGNQAGGFRSRRLSVSRPREGV